MFFLITNIIQSYLLYFMVFVYFACIVFNSCVYNVYFLSVIFAKHHKSICKLSTPFYTWQESLTSTQYQYKYTHIYTNKHSVYQTQYNISKTPQKYMQVIHTILFLWSLLYMLINFRWGLSSLTVHHYLQVVFFY
jgi:hypothetical protein